MDIILTGTIKGVLADSVGSITSIATIAALRALTTSTGPDSPNVVYVEGWGSKRDGGQGFLQCDTSDANAATASFTGTSDGATYPFYIDATSVVGHISVGDTVTGAGYLPGTYITSQASGTAGGAGRYITNGYPTVAGAVAMTSSADNGATCFVDASSRRWYRLWDGITFLAAWAGILPTNVDNGALLTNLPAQTFIWFQPGEYQFLTYPTMGAFSSRFYRGTSYVFQCHGTLNPPFSDQPVAFNWSYVVAELAMFSGSSSTYAAGGTASDMTAAGLGPMDGGTILSQLDGVSGIGLALGRGYNAYPLTPYPFPYPQNYYLRPKNFSVGGFYLNVAHNEPINTFLTGLESVIMKRGVIGWYYFNVGLNSGENLVATKCNFNGMTSDGFQMFSAQKLTFNGPCSFTYCNRFGYSSNEYTVHTDSYFETSSQTGGHPSGTKNELWAIDGGSVVQFDSGVSFVVGVDGTGWQNADFVSFFPGSGGYGQCFFNGASVCNYGGLQYNPGPTFLNNSPGLQVYGHVKGFNGINFQSAVSPDSLLAPDWQFASGGLTLYPGSANASVAVPARGSVTFTANPTATQTLTINGTAITFVASGATGNQVNIGASLALTFIELLFFLQSSANAGLVACAYTQAQDSWGELNTNILVITAFTTGTGGNAITLATTVTGATRSAATLTGGAGTAVTPLSYFNQPVYYNYGTRITSFSAPSNCAVLASISGTSTLQTSMWDVVAGEQINVVFWDQVTSGGPGFNFSVPSVATFYTADGVQISTTELGQFASIPNFWPGTNHLNTSWGNGSAHNWTIERFVFRVPIGASKMAVTINVSSSTTGTNYCVANFMAYSNRRP